MTKTKDFGCTKSVVSQALKSSFGWHRTPTGKTITVSSKLKWLGSLVAVLGDLAKDDLILGKILSRAF
jgi:hypothetical protein